MSIRHRSHDSFSPWASRRADNRRGRQAGMSLFLLVVGARLHRQAAGLYLHLDIRRPATIDSGRQRLAWWNGRRTSLRSWRAIPWGGSNPPLPHAHVQRYDAQNGALLWSARLNEVPASVPNGVSGSSKDGHRLDAVGNRSLPGHVYDGSWL